jgi:predicted permease
MTRMLREWFLRLWGTASGRRTDADLEEELRLHLELAAEDAERRGQEPDDARRAARLRVGGAAQSLDALRDQRGLPWLDAAVSGVGSLPRLVARHRGYFIFATATVALAVGINLAVFTLVNALWLRPLPFPEPDRLVALPNGAFSRIDVPPLAVFGGRVAGQVLTDDLFDLQFLKPRITFERIGRDLEILAVTPGYFPLFGLVVRGRDFTANDNLEGAEPVAIISDRLWLREFGRSREVIGAVLPTRPIAIRVIGVAPPGFEGARRGERAELWIPASLLPRVVSTPIDATNPLMIFARLGPGQSLTSIQRIIEERYAHDDRIRPYLKTVLLKDVFGTPESRTIVIGEGNALAIVGGLALLVLLGGCATLAALVLVHYERRRGELAVRLALGASRLRLTMELCRELLLVGVAGTTGALVVATWGLHLIPALRLPGGVDLGRLDLSIDWRVLAAAVASTALTLLVSAGLPVRRFTRSGLAPGLSAGPAPTPSAASLRARQALLALHVTAAIVVLIAAGLFVRAVVHGLWTAPGIDVDHSLFVDVRLRVSATSGEARRAQQAQAVNRVREALRSAAGGGAVSEGVAPISAEARRYLNAPVAVTTEGAERGVLLGRLEGSPNLLSTLGVPIVAGRGLTDADRGVQPVPTVVTASLARALWPTGNAVGQTASTILRGSGRLLIVGVSRDFVFGSLNRPADGSVVTAGGWQGGTEAHFSVRAVDPDSIVRPLFDAVRAAVPEAASVEVSTGRDLIARDLGRQRLGAWFFSGFGLVALLLGVLGVFGLVAHLAESRQREFGIRLALGATPGDLVRRGLVAAVIPVSAGLCIGLLCAAGISRLFTSLLTGLSALDPLTYLVVALTMLGCATAAGVGGAWRLRRLAPLEALRTE